MIDFLHNGRLYYHDFVTIVAPHKSVQQRDI